MSGVTTIEQIADRLERAIGRVEHNPGTLIDGKTGEIIKG